MTDGYFRTMYGMATGPGSDGMTHIWFGFAIVASPILLPLFYTGRVGEAVLRSERSDA